MNMPMNPPLSGSPKRSALEALKVHAGIRLKHARLTWLYLKPFLTKHLNRNQVRSFATHAPPDVGFLRYLAIKLLWLNASFWQQNRALMMAYGASGMYHATNFAFRPLEKSILKECEKRGVPSPRMLPIPEFDWRNRSPQEFVEEFIRNPFPVVLRGFSANTPASQTFNFDKLLEVYGDEQVLLTTREKDGFEGKLKDVRNPKIYCHNSEYLFIRHPELKALLGFDRLEPYSAGMKEAYSQLFIGLRGTGSPIHCAAVWNWFHMLDGRKRWYFADPSHSLFLYPVNVMGRVAATSHCSFPDQYNAEGYPLFKYCPFYEVELDPGDVLMVPPWWWHAVQNLTDQSVAVASRWHTGGVVGQNLTWTEEDYDVNRFFSVILQLGFSSPAQMQQLVADPSPQIDEHTTLRERKNRFVDRHYKLANEKLLGIFHKL